MKISSASKKVLASALSAAMVVAFSPAAALGGTTGLETDVQHKLDAGTVTVAPSCAGDGLMTYTCQDGDGFSIIAAIFGTDKHSWVIDTAVDGADANGFTWDVSDPASPKAWLNIKCANEEDSLDDNDKVDAVVTKAGTAANFFGAGEVTYTAKAKDASGKEYTSTKTVKSSAYSVINGLIATNLTWTDGNGLARVDIFNGKVTNKTNKTADGNSQTLTAVTTSKAVEGVKEGEYVQTEYTAEFELPAGVIFNSNTELDTNDPSSKYYVNTKFIEGAGIEIEVKDGKLVVEKTVTETVMSTAHTAATAGAAVKKGAAGFKTIAAGSGAIANAGDGDTAGTTVYYIEHKVTAAAGETVGKGVYVSTNGTAAALTANETNTVEKDQYYYTVAGIATAEPTGGAAESFTKDRVTVTYVGDGKMLDGTARANGSWTIETKCDNTGKHAADEDAPVVTAKTFADKVTKTSCTDGVYTTTLYTIEYSGGKYKLSVVTKNETPGEAEHSYVAKDTVWSYEGSEFVATTKYECPVDGDYYFVQVSTNDDSTKGDVKVTHNKAISNADENTCIAATVANASTKATSFANGTIDVTFTLKAKTGQADAFDQFVESIGGTAPVYTLKAADPKADAANFVATADVVTSSSKVTVRISDGKTMETKTYDMTSKHVNGTIAADAAPTAGYTVYTADIVLPEGVEKLFDGDTDGDGTIEPGDGEVATQVANGKYVDGKWTIDGDGDKDGLVDGKTIYQNADGSYSVKYKVTDKVTAVCSDANRTDGFLATEAAKWTVTDETGTTAKTYTATSVTVAEIAHTATKENEQKAYTITYGDGKTLVLDATGTKLAHKLSLKTFAYDVEGTGDEWKIVLKPQLVCSDCGKVVNAEKIVFDKVYTTKPKAEAAIGVDFGIADKKQVVYKNAGNDVVVGEYVFTAAMSSNTVFTEAPVFKWTSTVTDAGVVKPAVTATFTSADGKKQVILGSKTEDYPFDEIKIELVDAATSTYKATIRPEFIPDGYKGSVSDTHVVSLHDGHSMVLEKVEKATTTKSGYAQYYCNNDGQLYKVAIAKNDMKVSPISKSYKVSAVKKAKKTFTIKVSNAKGAVSFKSSSKKVTVSKSGKVTVKKGTAKGTYKVTVTSKATDIYAKATKTVTIRVK